MQKFFVVLAVLALPFLAFAGHKPKACTDSVLCVGLIEHYDFEEASDFLRLGSAGFGVFEEPNGQNIGNAVGKFGNAVVFAGTSTSYLNIKPAGNLGSGVYTLAFWVYPTTTATVGAKQSIISTGDDRLYLEGVAGPVWNARYRITLSDGSTAIAASTTTVTPNVYTRLVVVVDYSLFDPGSGNGNGAEVRLYVNNGSAASTIPSKLGRPALSEIRLGGNPDGTDPFTGRLDSFDSWDLAFAASDVSLDYNSGSGRAFPFSTP